LVDASRWRTIISACALEVAWRRTGYGRDTRRHDIAIRRGPGSV
jgi:hypothetical protein